MTLVAFASAKGSPGATTAALLLAASWPADRGCLLVEADPAGGDVAAWFQLGADPGLVSLAAAGRHELDAATLGEHVQRLPGGREVDAVLAPPSSEQATAALTASRGRLAGALGTAARDVLVDCGRLDGTSAAVDLALAADLLVWVVRPSVADVHHLAARFRGIGRSGATAVLVAGESPYSADDVAEAVGLATIGALPRDERAASALRGEAPLRHLERSALLRAARSVAESMAAVAPAPVAP